MLKITHPETEEISYIIERNAGSNWLMIHRSINENESNLFLKTLPGILGVEYRLIKEKRTILTHTKTI